MMLDLSRERVDAKALSARLEGLTEYLNSLEVSSAPNTLSAFADATPGVDSFRKSYRGRLERCPPTTDSSLTATLLAAAARAK